MKRRQDNKKKRFDWGKPTKKKEEKEKAPPQRNRNGFPIEGQRPVKPKPLPGEKKIER